VLITRGLGKRRISLRHRLGSWSSRRARHRRSPKRRGPAGSRPTMSVNQHGGEHAVDLDGRPLAGQETRQSRRRGGSRFRGSSRGFRPGLSTNVARSMFLGEGKRPCFEWNDRTVFYVAGGTARVGTWIRRECGRAPRPCCFRMYSYCAAAARAAGVGVAAWAGPQCDAFEKT